MKVVSWNIMHGVDIDGAVRALTEEDRLRDADVVLLQEMDEAGAKAIADALDLHYVYASPGIHQKSGRDFGNAVLCTAPLSDRVVIELPHKALVGGQPRLAISAVARLGGIDVTLCTTHTEIPALTWTRRLEQYSVLSAAAATWPTDRAIVGGDFNTVSTKGVRALTGLFDDAGYAHVSLDATPTLRRVGQYFTLDHAFARGLWPVESGVVRQLTVSDHAPIWVVLEA